MGWSAEIPLVGAGGEPVDLARTIHSHGLVELPPMEVDPAGTTLTVTLLEGRRATTLRIAAGRKGRLRVAADAPAERSLPVVRRMLRLDEDFSGFYAAVAADPDLAWAARGAGRMIRSPTVFEDVVKTICTTNCTWSATERMVAALVSNLGVAARDGRRAFPTAAAMADADEPFYKDVVRAGYRGPYFRTLADDVAAGHLDLEALNDPDLPDDEVAARLLALPGVGPYATAHMMMLLGRYSRLILDAWTRPKYARLNGRKASDKTIDRRFRRYREYAGLAFWLYLTRDWLEEPAGIR